MSHRPRGTTSRREVVVTLAAAGAIAALGPRAASAQARRPVIGGLIDQPRATNTNWSNFQATMAGLGWVDGQTVTFAWRFADGDSTRRMPLARELIQIAPDVLYAGNVNIAQVLKEATSTIPIIGALGTDEVAHELVGPDLTRPAHNVTGSLAAPAPVPILLAQRTALLKEAVPRAMQFGSATSSTCRRPMTGWRRAPTPRLPRMSPASKRPSLSIAGRRITPSLSRSPGAPRSMPSPTSLSRGRPSCPW